MDCNKARDRFSSLWEKELTPAEEKEIREHLASCPGCQQEMKQFEKVMQWLHSVEEEEVPDGFAQEFRNRLEEKRSKAPAKIEGGGFRLPLSFKLPVQAVAMIGILFLVLTITRMTPLETVPLKEHMTSPSSFPVEERSKEASIEKERDTEKQQTRLAADEQGKIASLARKEITGAKPENSAAPLPQAEVITDKQMDLANAGRLAKVTAEPEMKKKGEAYPGAPVADYMHSQDIVFQVSDREGITERVNTLVRQFGGEIVRTEKSALLVSLPTASIQEFKKELEHADALSNKNKPSSSPSGSGDAETMAGATQETFETDQNPAVSVPEQKNRTLVRILLIKK